jgi:hypothetical protein
MKLQDIYNFQHRFHILQQDEALELFKQLIENKLIDSHINSIDIDNIVNKSINFDKSKLFIYIVEELGYQLHPSNIYDVNIAKILIPFIHYLKKNNLEIDYLKLLTEALDQDRFSIVNYIVKLIKRNTITIDKKDIYNLIVSVSTRASNKKILEVPEYREYYIEKINNLLAVITDCNEDTVLAQIKTLEKKGKNLSAYNNNLIKSLLNSGNNKKSIKYLIDNNLITLNSNLINYSIKNGHIEIITKIMSSILQSNNSQAKFKLLQFYKSMPTEVKDKLIDSLGKNSSQNIFSL